MARDPGPSSQGRRQGVPTGAILLIVLGSLLLMQTTGSVSWDLWNSLWRFWPVIVIAAGLNLLLGSRAPLLAALLVAALFVGSVAAAYYVTPVTPVQPQSSTTSVSEPLGDLKSATVRITFGGGELRLTSLPAGSSSLVEGRLQTPGEAATATVKRFGDRADLGITMQGRRWASGFSPADWEVALSRSPRLTLKVDGGAAKMVLDLRDLQVTDLEIDTGASDVAITVPSHAGEVKLELRAGAANVDVLVPEGVAAQVRKDEGLSSFRVDSSRFPKTGDTYASPNFDTAVNRVTMQFKVGAANVRVR